MKIIDEFIQGKNTDESLCEDGIFKSDSFIAIIDGATSKSKVPINDKSSGRFAMEKIKEALSVLNAKENAFSAMKFISDHLAQSYKNLDIYEKLEKAPIERATASMVVYSKIQKELWLVGDCQAFINDKFISNNKKIDEVLGEARACFIQSELISGKTIEDLLLEDTGRDFIFPMLQRQGIYQNNPIQTEYSYGCIDGINLLEDGIKIYDASNAKSIVLASDGYPKLFNTLNKSESYLEFIIKNDPLCFKYHKSTKGLQKNNKSFDDRAYIKFKI